MYHDELHRFTSLLKVAAEQGKDKDIKLLFAELRQKDEDFIFNVVNDIALQAAAERGNKQVIETFFEDDVIFYNLHPHTLWMSVTNAYAEQQQELLDFFATDSRSLSKIKDYALKFPDNHHMDYLPEFFERISSLPEFKFLSEPVKVKLNLSIPENVIDLRESEHVTSTAAFEELVIYNRKDDKIPSGVASEDFEILVQVMPKLPQYIDPKDSIAAREGVIRGLKILAPYLQDGSNRLSQGTCIYMDFGSYVHNSSLHEKKILEACEAMGMKEWGLGNKANPMTYNSSYPEKNMIYHVNAVLGLKNSKEFGGTSTGRYLYFAGEHDLSILANCGVNFKGSEKFISRNP